MYRLSRAWPFGLILICLISLWGLHYVCAAEDMGLPGEIERKDENHDLRFLTMVIRDEKAPFKWFFSDWPLYNGFYRPFPTLTFELDNYLFDTDLNKFKITNWVISLACSFGLSWMVWEIFRSKGYAIACGSLFAAWQSGFIYERLPLETIGQILSGLVFFFGLIFGSRARLRWLFAAGLLLFLTREINVFLGGFDSTNQSFAYRVTGWPVGRTATVMTLFALISVAAYARFERLRDARWFALCVLSLACVFGSYEQSVVIPALLFGTAAALHFQKVRVSWALHIIPWVMLITYILLHKHFLVEDPSHYQVRAARGAAGGFRDLTMWLFPAYFDFRKVSLVFDQYIGINAVLVLHFWEGLTNVIANAIAYVQARKEWLPAVFGLLGSVGTYAPMAFQHPLAHYFHLPLAIRTIFVVAMCVVFYRTALSAVSLQGVRVAPRLGREPR